MSFAAAEADRRIANLISIGRVIVVGAGTARVAIGELETPDIPVGQYRAGGLALWWMPTVGEQVVVACPSGDLARAVILCSIYAGNAPSGDAAVPMIALAGGRMVVDGTLEVTGDVIAAGISLTTHTHGGVIAGGDSTGDPQ